jgi:hypothetical protein
MDREEINNIYRRPSIDASYQVSVHLAKWSQRRKFFICENRNDPDLVQAFLKKWWVENDKQKVLFI